MLCSLNLGGFVVALTCHCRRIKPLGLGRSQQRVIKVWTVSWQKPQACYFADLEIIHQNARYGPVPAGVLCPSIAV